MQNGREELKQQEIEYLSAKRSSLVEKPSSYFYDFVKDPKLEAIDTDIADLKRREDNYFKAIQVLGINVECSLENATRI